MIHPYDKSLRQLIERKEKDLANPFLFLDVSTFLLNTIDRTITGDLQFGAVHVLSARECREINGFYSSASNR
ncbi:hypothetical protein CHCC14688_3937 [Bacillus licheniformis]|nr:hypothetical protein CHCC14688_3937 [Bacillus licheniformis]